MTVIVLILLGIYFGLIVSIAFILVSVWNIIRDCYDPDNHKWRL